MSLRNLGCPLIMRKTRNTLSVLLEIVEATGATQVFFNHLYDPVSLVRDHSVKQGLVEHGVSVHSWNGDLLNEPWEVYDHKGQAFTTFDAYWEKCLHMPYEPEAPLLPPRQLRGLKCTTFLGVFFLTLSLVEMR
jgi:cryptochrome 1